MVLVFFAALLFVAAPSVAQPLRQERVLVVSRHGIRMPFPPLEHIEAAAYSTDKKREWFAHASDWGADVTAALTDHGKKVLKHMGAHFRETLLNGSKGGYTIYSDIDSTKRDINTAVSFFQGAYPDAKVTEKDMYGPGSAAETAYIKMLMNQGGTNTSGCSVSADMKDLILGEVGGNLDAVSQESKDNIMIVSDALQCCEPIVCTSQGNTSFGDHCTLMSVPTVWEGRSHYWEIFNGPLGMAGKLIEYVHFAYLNGMDWNQLVPSMTESVLASQMHLHEEVMAIADEYYNSRNSGSELLVHLAASMQQVVLAEADEGATIEGLHSQPDDALVYYAAHDINIYLLRRLLRIEWLTKSFNPNQSPPGGMLLLVLYSAAAPAAAVESGDRTKNYFVKAFFMSQSMQQQRAASPLSQEDPASRVFAVMPGCAHGPELSCPFEDFKRLVLREINQECVKLVNPEVLARPWHRHHDKGKSEWWIRSLIAGAALLVGLGLGWVFSRRCGKRSVISTYQDPELNLSLAQNR